MSNHQPTVPTPPYQRGDRIYDRAAVPREDGSCISYEVVGCHPISAGLAAALSGYGQRPLASWQVTFLLPTGHLHYTWVGDNGRTPALIFGPEPPQRDDLDVVLASYGGEL